MRTEPFRSLYLAGLALLTALPLRAQAPAAVTWTGSFTQRAGPALEVRYLVPAAPSGAEETWTVTAGSSPWRPGVTNIRFSGASVGFEAKFASGAHCELGAVPLRGYTGVCVMEAGDTARLSLVPPVPDMLLPDHEVALARGAAPPHLAAGATVYVLGVSGYVEAVRGTNELTCIIERPIPGNAWPICRTREASAAMLPAEQLRVTLRAAGIEESSIADSLARAYAQGRFHPPVSGAVGYMLSRHAWTVHPGTGAPLYLGPHLHFYKPYATTTSLGIDSTRQAVVPMRLEREGRPDASVVVPIQLRTP